MRAESKTNMDVRHPGPKRSGCPGRGGRLFCRRIPRRCVMAPRYTSTRRDVIKHGAVLGSALAAGASFPYLAPGAAAAQQLPRNETLFIAGHQWGPPTTFNPVAPDQHWPTNEWFVYIYESLYTFN